MRKFEQKLRKIRQQDANREKIMSKYDWVGCAISAILAILLIIFIGINT